MNKQIREFLTEAGFSSGVAINKMFKRKTHNVNSGWYHYIHPEFGSVWSGKHYSNGILVRKILFSTRRLKKRNTEPKRIFRGSKVARYWESEWGRTRFIHGITRNFAFKRRVEK